MTPIVAVNRNRKRLDISDSSVSVSDAVVIVITRWLPGRSIVRGACARLTQNLLARRLLTSCF
jgi:hypothetical protein